MFGRTTALLVATLCVSAARAQHADIYPYDDAGKVGVAQYNYDLSAVIDTRVFAGRFNSFYSVNDPGFIALATGPTLPGGEALQWDFLPMTAAGYTSTLLYWDGMGDVANFGATPTPDYVLSLYSGNGSAAADGGQELVTGASIGTTGASGSLHLHRYFFLDDNGDGMITTLPEDGFYMIAMQLRMAGLETSDPFFLVWGTPGSDLAKHAQVAIPWAAERADTLVGGGLPGDFNDDGVVDAADYTVYRDNERNLFTAGAYPQWRDNYGASAAPALSVPEPTSLLLVTTACCLIGSRRRNRG